MTGNTAAAIVSASGVDEHLLKEVCPRVDPAQVPVREAPSWFRLLWAKGIVAVATPWAIYVDPSTMRRLSSGIERERNARLIVHELMHVEQTKRLGPARHVLEYMLDYLAGRLRGASHWEAYRDVRFEVEARLAARTVTGAA